MHLVVLSPLSMHHATALAGMFGLVKELRQGPKSDKTASVGMGGERNEGNGGQGILHNVVVMIGVFAVLEMGPAYVCQRPQWVRSGSRAAFVLTNTAGSVHCSLLCRRDLTLQLLSGGWRW